MTTIRHGGPCGLRIEMRPGERDAKLAVFLCHGASKCLPHAQRGGVAWLKRSCGEAAFLYMPHSVVVIPTESSGHANDAESEKDESDPPPNRGVM